jgi:hypothetical protein
MGKQQLCKKNIATRKTDGTGKEAASSSQGREIERRERGEILRSSFFFFSSSALSVAVSPQNFFAGTRGFDEHPLLAPAFSSSLRSFFALFSFKRARAGPSWLARHLERAASGR